LSLPALHGQWPGTDPASAVAERKAAGKNKAFATAVPAGSEVVSAEVVNAFFREMKDIATLFRDVQGTDPARFAQIARQGAGVLSAWSAAAGAEGDATAKNLAAAVQRAYLSVDGNPIRSHFGGTGPMKGENEPGRIQAEILRRCPEGQAEARRTTSVVWETNRPPGRTWSLIRLRFNAKVGLNQIDSFRFASTTAARGVRIRC
jgi:hypothetical protein